MNVNDKIFAVRTTALQPLLTVLSERGGEIVSRI